MSLDDLKQLRKQDRSEHKEDNDAEIVQEEKWSNRIASQGPWDPLNDLGFSLDGSPSLPMPVKITAPADFEPFFEHIRTGGTHADNGSTIGRMGNEQAYDVELLEFPRGVIYADQRMGKLSRICSC